MSIATTLSRAVATIAISGIAVLGANPGTAHAAYSDCPRTYNCFFVGLNGTSQRRQFAGDNRNLMWENIQAMSGFNNGTSGKRACGYRSPEYKNLNYSRAKGDTASFSMRPIQSMRWAWTCPN